VHRLTSFVLRHKLLTALVWIVITIAGFATLKSTTNRLTTDFALPGQPGYVADSTLSRLYHNGGETSPTIVVLTAPGGAARDAARADQVFRAAAGAVPGTRLADQANTGDPKFTSPDGTTTFALLFSPPQTGYGADSQSPPITAAARAAAPRGWTVAVTGETQLSSGSSSAKGTSAGAETVIGGLGALAVLLFVFGSALALVPLLMALIAIPSTFLLINVLSRIATVSFLVEFLVALIGLGVAIDYSLLVVTRWREERDSGADKVTAVERAMPRAGRSVAFSGLTVAISLLALLVVPVPFLRNVAFAGFCIPLVSVLVSLTLLPALLATAGPGLDHPRLRPETDASRPWTAWARTVLRHRRIAAALGIAALLTLCVPLLTIRLGEPPSSALAQSGPAWSGIRQLSQSGTPTGVLAPMEVVTQPGDASRVATRLAAVPGVYTAYTSTDPSYTAGGTALVDVIAADEPSTATGSATTSRVVQVADALPGVVGVAGSGPTQSGFIHAVYGSFPLVLAVISLFTLVLLTRAFRSIVLAVKAVVFNLLSLGAAYGVMVLVWQHGVGTSALWNVDAAGAVSIWVPIMVFAVLFGLSMDYEVFILTRIREAYDATGDTERAVETGVGRTGRLVTSAALILFLSFLALSTAPSTDVKILATGLGAGILLDALIVRSLLVPSLVGVLGRWNWWLPTWAARIVRTDASPLPPTAHPAELTIRANS
jgi:RND superfamily putative drug exporter